MEGSGEAEEGGVICIHMADLQHYTGEIHCKAITFQLKKKRQYLFPSTKHLVVPLIGMDIREELGMCLTQVGFIFFHNVINIGGSGKYGSSMGSQWIDW